MGSRTRLKRDERGQMFILEVLTTGLLILAAINYVTTLPTPSEESSLYLHKWALQGRDVLRVLDNIPATEPKMYNSKLDQGICENVDIVFEQMNVSLPPSLSFNIYLRNMTRTLTIYYAGKHDTSSSARANYIIYLSGGYCVDRSFQGAVDQWVEINPGTYEVSVVIWQEVRGWS